MLFQIMIGNFLGLSKIIGILVLILLLLSLIKDIRFYIKKQVLPTILFLCCTLVYPFFSFLKDGGDVYILINNIYYIIVPFALLLYTGMLCSTKMNYVKKRLERAVPLLNAYALLNIFVMTAQLVYNRGLYSNSVTYRDSISGLFGIYGQPNITIYITAVVLLDCFISMNIAGVIHIFGVKINFICKVILISYMILAALNDNKAFYIIFILCVAYMWLISNYKYALQRNQLQRLINFLFKIVILILMCAILFFVLVNYTFVGDFYYRIIHEVTQGWNSTNLVQGSSERIGMISYALSNQEMRIDGYGLATTIWKQEFAFGFVHFGQSDMGVFIILGGLFFVTFIVAYIFCVINQILNSNFLAISGVVIMIIIGIYTQIFTTFTMMGCMILFLLCCWYACFETKHIQKWV